MATSASGSSPQTYKVGVIIGSQRVRRAGPQITDFVLQTIKAHEAALSASRTNDGNGNGDGPRREITFQLIDIAALNLPLLDEPVIPAKVPSPDGYEHEHTQAWARVVAALDGFVFVTPQYNWGIPAGLKNAIDYLFNEWKGKPAMIVSYGGHGGGKSAAQLQSVLGGSIRMRVVEETVNLSFPDREFAAMAAAGKELGLDAGDDRGVWAKERGTIVAVWEKMVMLLAA
jgi:NAD(P)H-dependent FMN reductase